MKQETRGKENIPVKCFDKIPDSPLDTRLFLHSYSKFVISDQHCVSIWLYNAEHQAIQAVVISSDGVDSRQESYNRLLTT